MLPHCTRLTLLCAGIFLHREILNIHWALFASCLVVVDTWWGGFTTLLPTLRWLELGGLTWVIRGFVLDIFFLLPCLTGEPVCVAVLGAWPVPDCEVEWLEEEGPSGPPTPSISHRVEPFQALVVRDHVEFHSGEVNLEVPYPIDYGEALFIHCRVVFLTGEELPRVEGHWLVLTFLVNLTEDRSDSAVRRVHLEGEFPGPLRTGSMTGL